MFVSDVETNKEKLTEEIKDRSVLVIGGAGSIGSEFIKSICHFEPKQLIVIDHNENGLAQLTRDLRSTYGLYVPSDYRTYSISYHDPIFERIVREEKGFDIVANFSAHKHVRSEKDKYSVMSLLENNDIKAKHLLDLMIEFRPRHFFCVSTDKAANPVNIMGASKSIMEEMIMAYSHLFPVTTARFANVAFSNGSLPQSFLDRISKRQPLVAPTDVKRYFVSPEESGQICMLACILGHSGEIFFPKLSPDQMISFSSICEKFVEELGYKTIVFQDAEKAKKYASEMPDNSSFWPVVYTKSDTTGEKAFEEFYVRGESLNMDRFQALGVIEKKHYKTIKEISDFYDNLLSIFAKVDFTKEEVVIALKKFLPNFSHQEKGKNLDQKM